MQQDIKNKKQYKHLNAREREIITALRQSKFTLKEIATELGRSESTISREIQRNSSGTYLLTYSGIFAQSLYQNRKKYASCRIRLKNDFIRGYVIKKIKEGISPELISGRLKMKYGESISHEAIYLFIYQERQDLAKYLVRSHRKRKHRGAKCSKQCSRIPDRVPIIARPKSIDDRIEYGHWEADTVVSRESKACLAVMVERSLRSVKIEKMKNKSAKEMKRCVLKMMKDVPADLRKSITYDNGLENVLHQEINARLGTKSYFCNPYHSWEKGTVENTIGLIRRFFPKKTDFACVTPRQVNNVQEWLNNRPRKCLLYYTSNELLKVALTG